jgi:hypothetical protein
MENIYVMVGQSFVKIGACILHNQWPRGLRRGSAAACLLGLRVRIPPGTWMSVCCECGQGEVSGRADHSSRGILWFV